jgi:hypothetical protein
MVEEELEELFPEDQEDDGEDIDFVQMAAQIETLAKRGAKHSGETMGHLRAMHDTLAKMTDGAVCGSYGKVLDPQDAEKLAKLQAEHDTAHKTLHESQAALAKVTEERDALTKQIEAASKGLDEAHAEIVKLKAGPMPGGPVRNGLHVVTKADDTKEPAAPEKKGEPATVTVVHGDFHNPEEARKAVRSVMAAGGKPYSPK